MKKLTMTSLLGLALFSSFDLSASGGGGGFGGGGYGRPARRRANPVRPIGTTQTYRSRRKPKKLSDERIRGRVNQFKSADVELNSVTTQGRNFEIKGHYQNRSSFAELLRKLRRSRKEKHAISVQSQAVESNTHEKVYSFVIKGVNLWQ